MKRLTIWARRTAMTFLFLMALLTTYQAMSGVDAKTYIIHRLASFAASFQHLYTVAEAKQLDPADRTEKPSPSRLEDEIDLSQYPKRTVTATGYTAGFESTGKNRNHPEYGITFSGVRVKRDLYSTIAADLNIFPIGSILFIPGYGYGVVADKGGAIKGNELDLYYKTVEDVYNKWGKKTLDVYIIEMGKGRLSESQLTAMNENKALQVFRQQYMESE